MSPLANRRWLGFWIVVIAVALSGLAWWCLHRGRPYGPSRMAFEGTSDQLRQTVIVPTLDTPIPNRKSAIWCGSFQIAWNHLKDDVAKAPIQLTNAQPIADLLNKAEQSEHDVESDAIYAAAGFVREGIVERIQTEMARKFPNVARPDLQVSPDGAVAYAYLAASSKYEYPFFENDESLLFKDSAGKETAVGSFGIRKKDDYAYEQLRGQVQVLYCPIESMGRESEVPEFIIDPCKTSSPYQIVIAQVDRKATLAETLADVESRITAQPKESYRSRFGRRAALIVPNIACKVSHRFRELEGHDKQFLNPALRGLYLDTAMQMIQFRLDRSGAELASESKLIAKPSATYYYVNRPFLVYMKKRESKQPFFVAWVDNAELLEKQ